MSVKFINKYILNSYMKIIGDFRKTIRVSDKGIKTKREKAPADTFISENVIKERISGLAKEISKDFKKDIEGIVILKSSIVFFSDLIREINKVSGKHVYFDIMEVNSYEKKKSTGKINIVKDVRDIKGKDVLIIEDVIDSGLTLSFLKKHILQKKKARSVRICSLIDKSNNRKIKLKADYIGFVVDDLFLTGYGMDYEQKYRALPYIRLIE